MAGDADNAHVWQGADVYINDTVGAAGPTDVTSLWATGWNAVGLLDGEEGFTHERDEDGKDYFAWGGKLVKRTKSKHKRTLKFVALEDNPVVFKLVNPGSSRTVANGVTTRIIRVPRTVEFAIGTETRDGNLVKRRWARRAMVEDVAEIKESEESMTVYELTIVVFPEDDDTLFYEVEGTVTAATLTAVPD